MSERITQEDKEAFELFFKNYPLSEFEQSHVELKPSKKFKNGYYIGEWNKQGEKHGRGIYIWESGARYEGEWRFGKRTGKGKFYYANGKIYEGDFKEDNWHGFGKVRFEDGERYEGDWRNAQREGYGIAHWNNGKKYRGYWKNNQQHGTGEWYDAKTEKWCKGEWEKGSFVKWLDD